MKDYYNTLRVRRGASTAEIRRAYRLLVQQLHPDINPDPTAHELIKEVNEAYDVLGDAEKKQMYDYSLDNPYTTVSVPQEPVHRDPAYKRRGAYRPTQSHGPTQRDLMTRLLPLVTWIAWTGCAVCFILLVDFTLPHRVIMDHTRAFENRSYGRTRSDYIVTISGRRLKVSSEDARAIREEQPIEIVESVLLFQLIGIWAPKEGLLITNLSTVYQNFKFIPFLLFAFSALGAIRRGSVEFRFNLGILNLFVLIFILIILLK